MRAILCRLFWMCRYLGPKWLAYRLAYDMRMRTGLLRRQLPASSWDVRPLSDLLIDSQLAQEQAYFEYRLKSSPPFFFDPSDRLKYQTCFPDWDVSGKCPVSIADQVGLGLLTYFEHTQAQVGFPPDWHTNPFTGHRTPAYSHWSKIPDFGSGDIKVIWEPSRFGFTYALVRAYWRTGAEIYPEVFWKLVEDWRVHNPPQCGVNWKCGQEVSFRVMAWIFGLYGFMGSPVTTPECTAALSQMIGVSGMRIEANMDYALSQRNNHSISEATGLWSIGTLFPEFRQSARWREIGTHVLERLGRELIYDDGTFVQHSVNYQRLMLHDYIWAIRLGDLHRRVFSDTLKKRVSRAGNFLQQIQNSESGEVPYFGENDGALILPLSNCDYQDFRPVVQAVHYMLNGSRCCQSGPWDEDLLWLFGPEALNSPLIPVEIKECKAEIGGCYTLRARNGFVFVRCATFKDRPGHADLLHVDLWWRGQNVACDAGTFSYNAQHPWDNSLVRTVYHNTVTVDRRDQMDRVSRFLWLPWIRSKVTYSGETPKKNISYWEGEHNGYHRLKSPVNHRRGIIRLGDDWWLILDRLTSAGEHTYELQWLIPDVPYEWNETARELSLQTSVGPYLLRLGAYHELPICSLARAEERTARGWRARYYNTLEPALSLMGSARSRDCVFWSLFGPEQCAVEVSTGAISIERAERWHATVHLREGGINTFVKSIYVTGTMKDELIPWYQVIQ